MSYITRRAARECAIQILYGYDFYKAEDKGAFFDFAAEESELESNSFARELFIGTCEHLEEIDKKIEENSHGWSLSRISRVSLAIMRLCVYEMMFTDVPVSISINEAMEIDKKFDKDDAPPYINGVLNSIAKGIENK